MSVESYSALDESSLRALLDGTVDLDERRLIRSAIRELRSREIEDMEAALASKRFRPTRLKQQEDKENQHRSEYNDNLDVLSRELQSIQDIDELTKMLRAAGEYEERKMIRAAIRQVRDEQQQQGTVERGKAPGRCLEPESVEPQSSMGTEETERGSHSEHIRSQILELRGQQTQQSRELQRKDSNSGMVLVLDHLVKDDGPGPLLIQPQREAVTTEPDLALSHLQSSDSWASDHDVTSVLSRSNLDSVASEKSLDSAYRARLDSGASDRSQSPLQRGRLDSGASEQSIGSLSYVRQRLGSDVSDSGARPRLGSGASDSVGLLPRKRTDSGTSEQSVSMSSEEKGPMEEVEEATSGSTCSTDSETESGRQGSASPHAQSDQDRIIDQEQPDGAVLSRRDPANGLLNGSAKGQNDFQKQKMTNSDLPLTHGKAKDFASEKKDVVEHFNRTNSVRDRMRKFAEPSQSPNVPALKKAALRNGTTSGSSGQTNLSRATELFTHTAASLGTSGDRPARPRVDSTSRTSAASQSQDIPQPRGVANKPLSSASQWQSSMGGTRHPAEKDVHASSNSKEDETPGRAAGHQVTQGEADPDMKTFLTIEIKDGRTTPSSTPSSRSNIVPITNMTPRITTNSLGQRADLTLGLRATPFKISSSSLFSGSSIKVETEPVVASEPVFSAGPSAQVACHIPIISNGSSTQAKPDERAGKLTAEQLAAIEDEELLDKMLDESKDFEERKMIRAAMRDLRKRKRGNRTKQHNLFSVTSTTSTFLLQLFCRDRCFLSNHQRLTHCLIIHKPGDFFYLPTISVSILHSEAMLGCTQEELDQREKERETRLQELRQQREERAQKGRAGVGAGEVVMRKVEKSADGSSLSQVTKTDRFASSDDGSKSTRSTVVEASYVQKTDRGTVQSKSYSYSSSTSSSSSNTSKKVGSVFDREDDTSSRGGSGGLAAVERRQAEKRKELMRAQTLPKTSAMQARKAMIEKLEKEGGGPGNQAVAKVNKVQRSTSFGVPNANSIKQMLLDWCRAKTRSYEHVDIQNFSSSWSNGMAFCALVHNFFPESFDYDSMSPSNRRQNFEVAFSTAEKLVDCPQLLDVDDMVKMREPDWKCVYTYLQEFYRGLVTKGLVKTKNSS
ncbi:smoothelin isoform X2 [Anarrhichthys ocellatus]|uniref:smoothelin isoform X2 n=1 Tax=Anarrhichthys ocellatus TaxID=433405 RepID=UPI0012ED2321|nr:smoothelin-like isoform X2 [Anarrhichthys ocellatus]